jgi:L-rhamnose 1-dehydrogenase
LKQQPLLDKVAIVTGAARGIGYAIAERYSVEGAKVVVSDINEELALKSAAFITEKTGIPAIAVNCDVTDRTSVDAMIERTVAEFGGLDIMVANAGICPFIEFIDMENATWQKTIDVILTGSFNSAQAAARVMLKQGRGGRLIFTTSLSTLSAESRQADYAAAKSGVKMLMASIATSLGKQAITCNAIAPGVIYTEMGAFWWDDPEHQAEFAASNPIPRLGQPEDIAGAAVFLASDDAEYITGSTIRVDGGRLAIG